MNWNRTRSLIGMIRLIRRSVFQKPGPINVLRPNCGTLPVFEPGLPPLLLTMPPVPSKSTPVYVTPLIVSDGLKDPLKTGLTGWPAAAVKMVDNDQPSSAYLAALFDRSLAYGGVQTALPVK